MVYDAQYLVWVRPPVFCPVKDFKLDSDLVLYVWILY